MQKIKIIQQYVNSGNIGGLKTEYQALINRGTLTEKYEFVPMVLNGCHRGISLRDIRFYKHEIQKAKPDIVHIRGAGIESLNAVIAAKMVHHGKILVTVHGMFSDLVYYSPIKRWLCKTVIEPLIFMLSDGISCVCKSAEKRSCFDRYRSKMLPCVYNRMPARVCLSAERKAEFRNELKLPSGAVIGVYAGRVTKEKGLSYLVGALKELDAHWPKDFFMLIVGDGEYRNEMETECSGLSHSARIYFAGQQNNVKEYLCASDFFVLPSLHENLSIAVLEACAVDLPCLVTNVGGNTEMIENGVNGLVIPPRSASDISSGIVRMCDKGMRAALEQSARQLDYSAFSNENVDIQLENVYEVLLNRNL